MESAGMEGGGRGLGGVPRGGAHPITQSGPTEPETLIPPRPLVLSLSWPREQGGQCKGYRVPGTGERHFLRTVFFFGGGGPPIVTFRCFVCPSGMYECLVLAGALQSVCRRATSSTPQGSPSEWPWPLVTGVLFGTKGDHDAMGLRAGMVPDAQGYLGIMTGRRPTEHGRRVWTSWRGRDRQR